MMVKNDLQTTFNETLAWERLTKAERGCLAELKEFKLAADSFLHISVGVLQIIAFQLDQQASCNVLLTQFSEITFLKF